MKQPPNKKTYENTNTNDRVGLFEESLQRN
jgi:hypothetical protein